MYSDKFLIKLSFIIAIIGIGLLFLFAHNIEPLEIDVKDIDDTYVGRAVKVIGVISEKTLTEDEKTLFLTVTDVKDIKVVMFGDNLKDVYEEFLISDRVIIEGDVALYKGDIEIIAESIKEI